MTEKQKEILWLQIGRLEGMSVAINSFEVSQIDSKELAKSILAVAANLENTFFPEVKE